MVADLNKTYQSIPALWEQDFTPEGFRWIDANDADNNVISFYRTGTDDSVVACICNLSPLPRSDFRVGLPKKGRYSEVLNTDAAPYGGTNTGNMGSVVAVDRPWHGLDYSADVTLPPLGVVWLHA
jgi:1,4-alpha-glucan branching enzyme